MTKKPDEVWDEWPMDPDGDEVEVHYLRVEDLMSWKADRDAKKGEGEAES